MSKKVRLGVSLGTVLVILMVAGVASADGPVHPHSVDETLFPGESIHLEKSVTTPEIPPKVDICLQVDETGSMGFGPTPGGEIQQIKDQAAAIYDTVAAQSDAAWCVIGFRDFDQDNWGSSGDWVYRRLSNVATDKATFLAGVGALAAGGGADGPEAQLEMLHYEATPGHACIDSNGNDPGVCADAQDTPAGQQPSWRPGAQRISVLVTDNSCHVTGDAGGWPGDAGTASVASTVAALNSAPGGAITVIGVTPGAAGFGCVDGLANGTGGSVQDLGAGGELIGQAILDGLAAVTTDVWWELETCDADIIVSLLPDVREDVEGNTTVFFEEWIGVPNETDPDDYHCTVKFIANEYPLEGEEIGRQEVWIEVVPIPVPLDVKPQSCRNPLNVNEKGVLPVAILGTADFDATQVDPDTVALEGVSPLRWNTEDVATPYSPFLGKTDAFDCTDEGPDGFLDLTLKFDAQEIVAALGAVSDGDVVVLTLTADLFDGKAITGEDVVVIVEKGKP